MANLTEKQAYQAMILYLQEIYRRTGSTDLGGIIGEMSFLPDGASADPAAWNDWLRQVRRVLAIDFDPSATSLHISTSAVRQKIGT